MGLDATRKWDAEIALGGHASATDMPKADMAADALIAAVHEACPEVVDLYLPDGAGKLAVATVRKTEAGLGPDVLTRMWAAAGDTSALGMVIVCDAEDVNGRDWNDVIWAVTTRMDPGRDSVIVRDAHGGSRMGWDATNKWPSETSGDAHSHPCDKPREWGTPISKDPAVVAKIDALWPSLGIRC